jgi:cell wall-associated NlpC family hydrolase
VSVKPLLAALAAAVAGTGGWLAVSDSSEAPAAAAAPVRAAAAPAPAAAEPAKLPPLPEKRTPTVVEPVAGAADLAAEEPAPRAPRRTRRRSVRDDLDLAVPATAGDGVHDATALPNGIALPPLEAPEAVRQIIEAGNVIARSPYLWGGGHGKWVDKGYDCSGSVSFALAAAGLLDAPLASGPLMSWGGPGPGKWVTIYTNPGHVFMVVAGIRFDTSGQRVTGSRWQNDMRSTAGFVARHPAGL